MERSSGDGWKVGDGGGGAKGEKVDWLLSGSVLQKVWAKVVDWRICCNAIRLGRGDSRYESVMLKTCVGFLEASKPGLDSFKS